MKTLAFYLTALVVMFTVGSASAADLTIDMLNKDADGNKMVYSNELARVEVGETITWLPASKGHNVEWVAGPEGADLPKKSKNGKEVSMTFEVPGIYYYWFAPH